MGCDPANQLWWQYEDEEKAKMSIFRTVRRLSDCPSCEGSGRVRTDPSGHETGPCDACGGSGKVEVLTRASRTAVKAAEIATKSLPPRERKAAKARLQDAEPGTNTGKDDGFVEEE